MRGDRGRELNYVEDIPHSHLILVQYGWRLLRALETRFLVSGAGRATARLGLLNIKNKVVLKMEWLHAAWPVRQQLLEVWVVFVNLLNYRDENNSFTLGG